MNGKVINQLRGIINSYATPQNAINYILQQNPNLQVTYNQMMTSGLSPKDFVIQYARQNNIPIDRVSNVFDQMINVANQRY